MDGLKPSRDSRGGKFRELPHFPAIPAPPLGGRELAGGKQQNQYLSALVSVSRRGPLIESLIDQQLAAHSGGHVFFSTAAANLEWQSIEIFL